MLKKWKSFYFGIWDTAGQEKFSRISSYYSRGAQAAILAYDITDRRTFENLGDYMKFLVEAEKNCHVVIIGTKLDLVKEDPARRQVTEEMAQEFASQNGALSFETSAKDGVNVSGVFDTIGYQCFASKLAATDNVVQSEAPTTVVRAIPTFNDTRPEPSRVCCVIQ